MPSADVSLHQSTGGLEKYVGPVPTYYAAVRLELYNPNHNPDLWAWN